MDIRLNTDDQVVLLLCYRDRVPPGQDGDSSEPYTLSEWNALAKRIASSPLRRPASLLGLDAAVIANQVRVSRSEGERIAHLMGRGGMLAIELERLASLGIRVATRASDSYPTRLRAKLRELAPTVLFYSGDLTLCDTPALAIVGSRDVDEAGEAFAIQVSRWAAGSSLTVVSGAARGVDSVAMKSALDAGGTAIGVPAESLERLIRGVDVMAAIADDRLLLLTPYHPRAPFSIGAAMGRNKIVYGLAKWALVVAAALEEGGTWAGAVEALRARWTPVFVRDAEPAPSGNKPLVARGALPFPTDFAVHDGAAGAYLERLASSSGADSGTEQPQHVARSRDTAGTQAVVGAGLASESGSRGSVDGRSSDELPAAREASPSEPHSNSPYARTQVPTGTDKTPTPSLARLADLLPELEAFLACPRTEGQLAQKLQIRRTEARGVLKALVESGRVRRVERPVRYQLVPMTL